jgi:hypothetical protein
VSVVGGSSATALEPPFEYNGNAPDCYLPTTALSTRELVSGRIWVNQRIFT